jgi:hypothetical protein
MKINTFYLGAHTNTQIPDICAKRDDKNGWSLGRIKIMMKFWDFQNFLNLF